MRERKEEKVDGKRNGAGGGFISLILIKTLGGPPLSSCLQLVVPLPPRLLFASLFLQFESHPLSSRANRRLRRWTTTRCPSVGNAKTNTDVENCSTRGCAFSSIRVRTPMYIRLYVCVSVCVCVRVRGIPGRHPRLVVARSIN